MSSYSAYAKDLKARIIALPLKEMDALLLEEGIMLELVRINLDKPGTISFTNVARAIQLAAYLHRNQTRADRREMPVTHYIEHPLRNALRLLRYGVTDEVTIIAALLHDTVEDCADEMVAMRTYDPSTMTEQDKRDKALGLLTSLFPIGVADIVLLVSNPLYDGPLRSRDQKHDAYHEHVIELLTYGPSTALVKFSDWVDNALSLQHNDPTRYAVMTARLANKYKPLVSPFVDRLQKPDVKAMLSPEGYDQAMRHLVGGAEILGRLATS